MVRAAIALLALPKREVAALVRDRVRANPWLVVQPELPFPSSVPAECDLIVRKDARGYGVELHPRGLPSVTVNGFDRLDQASPTARRLHNEAVWLVKGLARRATILQRVASAVVHIQEAWLDGGRAALAPLTQREVAEQCGLHPSTVSRATANKLLFIEDGPYAGHTCELRTLVTTRPRIEGAVQAVAALLAHEAATGGRPLSDAQIAAFLKSRGCQVARRTVAKYRARLGFGHAYQRRRP